MCNLCVQGVIFDILKIATTMLKNTWYQFDLILQYIVSGQNISVWYLMPNYIAVSGGACICTSLLILFAMSNLVDIKVNYKGILCMNK